MNKEEFKKTAVKAVEAMGVDIERIDWHPDNKADFYVLEGGYEPARIRASEVLGAVHLGYK